MILSVGDFLGFVLVPPGSLCSWGVGVVVMVRSCVAILLLLAIFIFSKGGLRVGSNKRDIACLTVCGQSAFGGIQQAVNVGSRVACPSFSPRITLFTTPMLIILWKHFVLFVRN